ncbi:acyl-CoA thioesterase [Pseudomonas sp. NPDC090203]|uniref:acyl-CoA thioesterase n=1 Tax=Pseudomonas sp. NPDC090203 TaxID=3364477 RepID=UPI0037F3C0A7
MSQCLTELVELFDMEIIEQGIFRGQSQELHLPQLFGGQVLGQAAKAATLTVPAFKALHSIHGYFIRAGRASAPVLYEVTSVHDGRSFSNRQIKASQDGRVIFSASASFQIAEPGFSHQPEIEQTQQPETCVREIELLNGRSDLAEQVRLRYSAARAIDIRPVDLIDPSSPHKRAPLKKFWFRADGSLPNDPVLHNSVLAYASDIGLLITSLLPHGVSDLQEDMQVASLDHSLRIHCPVKVDDWLLYAMDSPWAGSGRGLSRGLIYDRSGSLIATVCQEGLIRKHGFS